METIHFTRNYKPTQAETLIRTKLALLGFDFTKRYWYDEEKKSYVASQEFEIDPKTLGQFGPAIKSMGAKVTCSFIKAEDAQEDRVYLNVIIIRYDYKHPNGSNGYTVTLVSKDGVEWIDRSF